MKKWYVITGVLALSLIISIVSWYQASSMADLLDRELHSTEWTLWECQNNLSATESQLQSCQSEIQSYQSELQSYQEELQSCQGELQLSYIEIEEARFDFYYATLAKQRYGVDDLEDYLSRWQWIEGTYVENEFDCSEMSAYLEWRLENEGYHTIIVIGDTPWGGGGRHSWLLVETSLGKYMPLEATTYSVVYWDDLNFDNYFEYDHEFETIQEALEYSPTGYDWWKS